MTVPGETEAGSAGMQLCRGITWRAHRDDDRSAEVPLPRSSKNQIGSVDPDALKIPARRAECSLTQNARSPFHAEPGQDVGPILARIAAADVETMIKLLGRRRSASPARSQWNKNQDRDRIILNCLERPMAREMVCEELDKRTISTLPGLCKKGLHTWKGAWQEPVGRQAIQQLFSKLTKRQKGVKPLDVSE